MGVSLFVSLVAIDLGSRHTSVFESSSIGSRTGIFLCLRYSRSFSSVSSLRTVLRDSFFAAVENFSCTDVLQSSDPERVLLRFVLIQLDTRVILCSRQLSLVTIRWRATSQFM